MKALFNELVTITLNARFSDEVGLELYVGIRIKEELLIVP